MLSFLWGPLFQRRETNGSLHLLAGKFKAGLRSKQTSLHNMSSHQSPKAEAFIAALSSSAPREGRDMIIIIQMGITECAYTQFFSSFLSSKTSVVMRWEESSRKNAEQNPLYFDSFTRRGNGCLRRASFYVSEKLQKLKSCRVIRRRRIHFKTVSNCQCDNRFKWVGDVQNCCTGPEMNSQSYLKKWIVSLKRMMMMLHLQLMP